jgi:hypothetical protein
MFGNRVLSAMQSKSLFIILLLAVYIGIPIADSIACDDCGLPAVFEKEAKLISVDRMQEIINLSVIVVDTSKATSSTDNGIAAHCPLCSNSASGLCAYNVRSFLSLLSSENSLVLTAHLEPSLPITKPPQN